MRHYERMTDILARICADKREHVKRRKAHLPEARLVAEAKQAGPTRGFEAALTRAVEAGRYALIAEIKKAVSRQIDGNTNDRNERPVWQRRFWEHAIRNPEDLNHHRNYITNNPVKQKLVQSVSA